jgi:hypothetical protein
MGQFIRRARFHFERRPINGWRDNDAADRWVLDDEWAMLHT